MPSRWTSWALLLGLLPMAAAPAHAVEPTENQLKAVLLYKFAQFTTWPSLPTGEFTLCVLGENPMAGELDKLKAKKLFQLPVNIKQPTTAEAAKACQVVYLNPSGRADLVKWIGVLDSLPVLTVSDSPDAWRESAMIVLDVEPNGIKFRINLSAARAANLGMSAQMLQLAREVR
ncbi:YfiR family protein [Methylomagnum sp.]